MADKALSGPSCKMGLETPLYLVITSIYGLNSFGWRTISKIYGYLRSPWVNIPKQWKLLERLVRQNWKW